MASFSRSVFLWFSRCFLVIDEFFAEEDEDGADDNIEKDERELEEDIDEEPKDEVDVKDFSINF